MPSRSTVKRTDPIALAEVDETFDLGAAPPATQPLVRPRTAVERAVIDQVARGDFHGLDTSPA